MQPSWHASPSQSTLAAGGQLARVGTAMAASVSYARLGEASLALTRCSLRVQVNWEGREKGAEAEERMERGGRAERGGRGEMERERVRSRVLNLNADETNSGQFRGGGREGRSERRRGGDGVWQRRELPIGQGRVRETRRGRSGGEEERSERGRERVSKRAPRSDSWRREQVSGRREMGEGRWDERVGERSRRGGQIELDEEGYSSKSVAASATFAKRLAPTVSPERTLAVVRLLRIEQGGAYADLLAGEGEQGWEIEMSYVERSLGFRTPRLDARSRRQVTELVSGVVRWKRFLDFVLADLYTGGQRGDFDRLEPLLLQILRVGLYEITKGNKAEHAAVNEAAELAKAALRPGAANLVNAMLRTALRKKESSSLPLPTVEGDERSRARALAVIHSHPVWMVRRWMDRFGESEAEKLMTWNNGRPGFSLRANSLRGITAEDLQQRLLEIGVQSSLSPLLPDFVRLQHGMQDVLQAGLVRDGICNVQDGSAGIVVTLLDPQPSETVVDCCAAPGGKTTFAAARMKAKGRLIAMDVKPARLSLVRQALQRQLSVPLSGPEGDEQHVAGHGPGQDFVVEYVAGDLRDVCNDPRLQAVAHRVLLDAPCSGLGVLSKVTAESGPPLAPYF